MSAPTPAVPSVPAEWHRAIAEELFHQVLGLCERRDRTCAESDRMVHAAHASRFHWEFGGTVLNMALGEWQCARVHTLARQPDAALHHGWTYLEMAESYELGPFHVAYAHLALAGAFALTKNEEAERHRQIAREILPRLSDKEEIEVLERELAEGESPPAQR